MPIAARQEWQYDGDPYRTHPVYGGSSPALERVCKFSPLSSMTLRQITMDTLATFPLSPDHNRSVSMHPQG
jgi:hypothetical protein